jgi:hypothetical protein
MFWQFWPATNFRADSISKIGNLCLFFSECEGCRSLGKRRDPDACLFDALVITAAVTLGNFDSCGRQR